MILQSRRQTNGTWFLLMWFRRNPPVWFRLWCPSLTNPQHTQLHVVHLCQFQYVVQHGPVTQEYDKRPENHLRHIKKIFSSTPHEICGLPNMSVFSGGGGAGQLSKFFHPGGGGAIEICVWAQKISTQRGGGHFPPPHTKNTHVG